ncbi:MAG TPA: hypothetical protein PLX97_08560 [Gemmatales bacterium]|nr:hypothetical protein [Gemmatales bacterium]
MSMCVATGCFMQRELNVLALHKGTEHYLFLYDDNSLPNLVDVFRSYASDKELSFNWFDAAVMTEKGKAQLQLEQGHTVQPLHTPRFPAETAG